MHEKLARKERPLTLFSHLELELHGLEGGGGLDGPGAGVLRDVHLRRGHRGRLPQQEAHVQSLAE